MSKSKNQQALIPESFTNIEESADFWDNHSTADYDDFMRDVNFDVDIQQRRFSVSIESSLAKEIMSIAQQ